MSVLRALDTINLLPPSISCHHGVLHLRHMHLMNNSQVYQEGSMYLINNMWLIQLNAPNNQSVRF